MSGNGLKSEGYGTHGRCDRKWPRENGPEHVVGNEFTSCEMRGRVNISGRIQIRKCMAGNGYRNEGAAMSGHAGFSLIELIVVIAILGVLIGLILPAIQAIRQNMIRLECQNNLKQIGLAMQNYHSTHGHLPPGYSYTLPAAPPEIGKLKFDFPKPHHFNLPIWPGWGWAAHILSEMDDEPLARRIDLTKPVSGVNATEVRVTTLKMYRCPADTGAGVFDVLNYFSDPVMPAASNSYAASFGWAGKVNVPGAKGNGAFYANSAVRLNQITDGTSQTILVGERAGSFTRTPWVGVIDAGSVQTTPEAPVYWTMVVPPGAMPLARVNYRSVNDVWSEPYDFWTPHPSGIQFAFGDGSTRLFKMNTPIEILSAMATITGGESLAGDR